jgi:16S rRNA (guanine(527)-N(7))-methyltransferase GidB
MQSESEKSGVALLNDLLIDAGIGPLSEDSINKFEAYLSLFVRWNARTNLSSVREPGEIVSRHFVESIFCARSISQSVSTLLDFGSGGGLPGVPIAICRDNINVTLAESQGKKSAFLLEAARSLGLNIRVYAGRAELLQEQFDCVTLRAVDRMSDAVRTASRLVNHGGWLALMTTNRDVAALKQAAGDEFDWQKDLFLPQSHERVLAMGVKQASLPA